MPKYAEKLLAKKQVWDDIQEYGYDTKNHTVAEIHERPDCDICGLSAMYDARTKKGWGYLCGLCFSEQGCQLGEGKGQQLIIK